MHWEKKICIRFTTRRIMGAILMASTAANLVIVGAMFEAASSTSTPTLIPFITSPTQLLSATSIVSISITSDRFTSTPIPTSLASSTSTVFSTDLPTLAVCVLRSYWPIYAVQQGDTLLTLALATGSTIDELMLANCLADQDIYPRQLLYVPRMPFKTLTPTQSARATDTPTATRSITPTDTPTATPTNSLTATSTNTPTETPTPTSTETPTEFQNPNGMSCDPPAYVSFSVAAYDPQEVISVTALLYTKEKKLINQIAMELIGNSYAGGGTLPQAYTVFDIDYYMFRAMDGRGNVTVSQIYQSRSSPCEIPTVGFHDGRDEAVETFTAI